MTADYDWRQRLADAETEWLRRRTARAALRRELDVARQAGLRARHAQKLARNRQEQAVPDVPPCCAGLDKPCPQHQQAARVIRSEGLRNRSGRGYAVIGEPGKAKPAPTEEKP